MTEPRQLHYYDVFSLRIASELALPELLPSPAPSCVDVEIKLGRTPCLARENEGYTVAEDGTLLSVAEAGRYWISEGRSIIVEPGAGRSGRNLRLYLLGSALGALLHQRGLLPIHANAIEIEGRAVLFMGHPGAGKSTMAAWFHDAGFRILSDDVCVVTFDEQDGVTAHPGIPRLRLWREALEASGRTTEGYELAFDDMEKFNVPVAAEASSAAVPLSRIYLLGKAEEGAGSAKIEPLVGAEAVHALVANTYRGGFVPMIGATKQHLLACVELANRIPIFSAKRVWGFDSFQAEALALREHVSSG